MHAETFDIVVRIIQRADFQLAAVARSRVHFPNVQGSAEAFARPLIYLPREYSICGSSSDFNASVTTGVLSICLSNEAIDRVLLSSTAL